MSANIETANIETITAYLTEIRRGVDFISPEVLDPIPFHRSGKDTRVSIVNPEFTSLCPKTGLPDYGIITIDYLPDQLIVELKSLKYYFLQFRNAGIFYEHLTPLIMDHLVQKLQPLEMTVEADFSSRGGITSKITSSYKKSE